MLCVLLILHILLMSYYCEFFINAVQPRYVAGIPFCANLCFVAINPVPRICNEFCNKLLLVSEQ